jgi:hypothetical protein
MQYRDRTVTVREGELVVVPRGVEHCPRADRETHVLLFEPAGTLNTGDAGGDRTVAVQSPSDRSDRRSRAGRIDRSSGCEVSPGNGGRRGCGARRSVTTVGSCTFTAREGRRSTSSPPTARVRSFERRAVPLPSEEVCWCSRSRARSGWGRGELRDRGRRRLLNRLAALLAREWELDVDLAPHPGVVVAIEQLTGKRST